MRLLCLVLTFVLPFFSYGKAVTHAGLLLRRERQSAQGASAADEQTKSEEAQELIRRARAALGGEQALGAIKTLSVSGKTQRPIILVIVQSPKKVVEKRKSLAGKIELNFLLPDKFRMRTSEDRVNGYHNSYLEVVNGERAWRNPPLHTISSYKDSRVIDVGDFDRTIEMQRRGARQMLTIYSLGLLLKSIPSYPLQYSYLGMVKSNLDQDGGSNAIRVTDKENHQIFLLLDPKTNLPLALAWKLIARPQIPVFIAMGYSYIPQFNQDMIERKRQEMIQRIAPRQNCEMQIRFSDYRQVSGVLLPHHLTTAINGEIIEELTFNDYVINQEINPKKFEGEPEPKY